MLDAAPLITFLTLALSVFANPIFPRQAGDLNVTIPASALPSGAPTSAIPTSAIPTSAIPTSATPTGAVPSATPNPAGNATLPDGDSPDANATLPDAVSDIDDGPGDGAVTDGVSMPFLLQLSSAGQTLPDYDRARVAALLKLAIGIAGNASLPTNGTEPALNRRAPAGGAQNVQITNNAVTYIARVGVGSPPTVYDLLIDTGSANTWVGAGTKYRKTKSSKGTGQRVSVTYGSGSFSGTQFTDTVAFTNDLTITGQSIGVASNSNGFAGYDGILGLGPQGLTSGTVQGQNTIPTVTDNLFSQQRISANLVGISFNPTRSTSSANGALNFGAPDQNRYTGQITYAPITGKSPASAFWGIDQSITYGKGQILRSTAGIVDTGTTLVLIASDAFAQYRQQTGGVMDSKTGLLKISDDQYKKLQSLFFNIAGTRFELTPNAQIWPRNLNSQINGDKNGIYLIVADLGTPSGQGLDFVNGYTFLERFYSVYDTSNHRVGLATTKNTKSTTN